MSYIRTYILLLLVFWLANYPVAMAWNNSDSSVYDIDVKFCDDQWNILEDKHLKRDMMDNPSQQICMRLINRYDAPLLVNLWFVDGTYTVDELHHRSCKSDIYVQEFGQYITWYRSLIVVPAQSSIIEYATLQFPSNSTGTALGCLAYRIQDEASKASGWLFDIIIRKAKFIDLFFDWFPPLGTAKLQVIPVDDFDEKKNIVLHPLLYVTKKLWEDPSLRVKFDNREGDIDQKVVTRLRVSNLWGNDVYQSSQNIKLTPHSQKEVLYILDQLPWYKGYFSLSMKIEHWPVWLDGSLPSADTVEQEIYTTQLFIFPVRIAILMAVIYVLIQLFSHHKIHRQPVEWEKHTGAKIQKKHIVWKKITTKRDKTPSPHTTKQKATKKSKVPKPREQKNATV